MFADTDFLVALIKKNDWLKESAMEKYARYRGELTTSVSVMMEIAIVCKRLGISIGDAFASVLQLVNLDENSANICLKASVYIDEDKVNVFDAFHAAYCQDDTIISSDSIYDRIGLERIKLEN